MRDTEQLLRDARGWADTAEGLAESLRNDRGLMGEDWVMLNALAEDLRSFANDLQQDLAA